MISTCPVCNQTADYPEHYAYKWHRCLAGCVAAGTRLFVIPDGVSEAEGEGGVPARARWLAVLPALAVLLPFLTEAGSVSWVLALLLAGLGAAIAAAIVRT